MYIHSTVVCCAICLWLIRLQCEVCMHFTCLNAKQKRFKARFSASLFLFFSLSLSLPFSFSLSLEASTFRHAIDKNSRLTTKCAFALSHQFNNVLYNYFNVFFFFHFCHIVCCSSVLSLHKTYAWFHFAECVSNGFSFFFGASLSFSL